MMPMAMIPMIIVPKPGNNWIRSEKSKFLNQAEVNSFGNEVRDIFRILLRS
jgi:hypothetical protein